MPSIQIDLPLDVDPDVKRDLARNVGAIYATTMEVNADLLTVSIHDLGHGGVWRCHEDGDPTPSALIMCDIRHGRPVPTRAVLAQQLIDLRVETFDLGRTWLKVEFTQHAGDEMYHPHLHGFNKDWDVNERAEQANPVARQDVDGVPSENLRMRHDQ
jgi:phenylpyruvate tautomerase PptA (4-oxalocrotonate tautomerase family)